MPNFDTNLKEIVQVVFSRKLKIDFWGVFNLNKG